VSAPATEAADAADGWPADLIQPRWGRATLADVMPAALASLGVEQRPDPFGLGDAARVVVLLVDGLGSVDLAAHADAAPYLTSLPATELTAGFPSTTVTSLTSLATGLPAGEHGLPGYTTWEADRRQAVAWLGWHPVGSGDDLREELPPEQVQPHPTVWERAEAAGVATAVVNARRFEGTGLTRAAFRGGRYVGVLSDGDAAASVAAAADRGHRSLVYAYLPQLDLMGHVRGPGSDPWLAELSLVDGYAALLAERLPAGTTLLVTGDHGMVELDRNEVVDADGETEGPVLREGVVAVAGEPRMRHVHAQPGAAGDVLAAWRSVVGARAWVGSGDEAVQRGLFGPVVTSAARARIGDVVAIARGGAAIVQSRRESRMSAMPGHHGSLTDRDVLVPLAVARV
jgi:hypothetical protein